MQDFRCLYFQKENYKQKHSPLSKGSIQDLVWIEPINHDAPVDSVSSSKIQVTNKG